MKEGQRCTDDPNLNATNTSERRKHKRKRRTGTLNLAIGSLDVKKKMESKDEKRKGRGRSFLQNYSKLKFKTMGEETGGGAPHTDKARECCGLLALDKNNGHQCRQASKKKMLKKNIRGDGVHLAIVTESNVTQSGRARVEPRNLHCYKPQLKGRPERKRWRKGRGGRMKFSSTTA